MMQTASPKGIPLSEPQRLDWLQLIRCENVGPITFLQLLGRFGTASAALEALPELAAQGGRKSFRLAERGRVEDELARVHRMRAQLVTLGEPNYPPALRAIDDPPPVLAVAGDATKLVRHSIAFVGSRNASLAGTRLTRTLAEDVSKAGYSVVSGFARGIDTAAHQASLNDGTVAVFAGGLDHIYPPQNASLAHEIVDAGGALVSEMPLGWKPRAQDFPRRNRIVAGMALATVVVEAAKRSGSLISARLANEAGRLVFAVPGSPLDPRSEGGNHLIKQGANLLTSASDIIDAVEPLVAAPSQSQFHLSEQETVDYEEEPAADDRELLLSAIGHSPTDVDEVTRFTGLSPSKVKMIILELEIAGRIERLSGNAIMMT